MRRERMRLKACSRQLARNKSTQFIGHARLDWLARNWDG